MLEAAKLAWHLRNWVGFAVLSVIIVFLYAANRGLHADVAVEKARNAELTSKISLQNASVDALVKSAEQRKKAAQDKLKRADGVAKKHTSRANEILLAPLKEDDECVAALELLREYQQ